MLVVVVLPLGEERGFELVLDERVGVMGRGNNKGV